MWALLLQILFSFFFFQLGLSCPPLAQTNSCVLPNGGAWKQLGSIAGPAFSTPEIKTLQVTTSKLDLNQSGGGKTKQRARNSFSLSSDNHPFQITFNYVFVIEVCENS